VKILPSQVLPALLALAFLVLAPSYALATDATSSEDTRGDTWITCVKGKGNNEKIVNISDCNSLEGRMQAGFKCSGDGMLECGEADLTCRDRGGRCVSPQGEICRGFSMDDGCQPPCKCSVGGGGGGGGRCSHALGTLEDCIGAKPDSLTCGNAPFRYKICIAESDAANECCAGGGGGGSKCESDGTLCHHRICAIDEINVCIDGQSVCCDPNSPGGGGGGGGGKACDPDSPITCNSNILCLDGYRLSRCDPEKDVCRGTLAYQCIETGGGGGGGMCEAATVCGVKCEVGTTCVDCDGDGIGETCQ
jgi:hypothetical protein